MATMSKVEILAAKIASHIRKGYAGWIFGGPEGKEPLYPISKLAEHFSVEKWLTVEAFGMLKNPLKPAMVDWRARETVVCPVWRYYASDVLSILRADAEATVNLCNGILALDADRCQFNGPDYWRSALLASMPGNAAGKGKGKGKGKETESADPAPAGYDYAALLAKWAGLETKLVEWLSEGCEYYPYLTPGILRLPADLIHYATA